MAKLVARPELPWLRDHQVQGDIVFPAAGMICAVIEALRQQSKSNDHGQTVLGFELRDISIPQALVIPNNDMGVEINLRLRPVNRNTRTTWFDFSFSSCQPGEVFVQNMRGYAQAQYRGPEAETEAKIHLGKELREETLLFQKRWQSWRATDEISVPKQSHYEFCKSKGITFGK
jgi:hypothetical protein